jgi:hypothetical protein
VALPENRPHPANLTPEEMRQGIKRLGHRIVEVKTFESDLTPDHIGEIHRRVFSTLVKVFGADTIEFRRYAWAAGRCLQELRLTSRNQLLDPIGPLIQYRDGLLAVLNEALSFLTEELDVVTDSGTPQTRAERRYGNTLPKLGHGSSLVRGDKVFLVHGHDRAARHEVARFIEQLKLRVIILDEQPSQSRTIIEKFEESAGEATFAVVLMTPDDIAGPAAAPSSATRARQNVIFELGYFAGKLGRDRVCVLRKGNVEIPSDLYGVVDIDLDNGGGWTVRLAKELKAAELKIDAEGML